MGRVRTRPRALYIREVYIKNVRCFEDQPFDFGKEGGVLNWIMFLGDNSTGKSTLLRSIAIGLCDQSSAAGLLKESDEGYIRRGASEATIIITLHDPDSSKKEYQIETTITREGTEKTGTYEVVRQETNPEINFPWRSIFACGYGAGRGVSGTGDIAGYSVINSVYNMFN